MCGIVIYRGCRFGYRRGEAEATFYYEDPHADPRPPPLAQRLPEQHPATAALPPSDGKPGTPQRVNLAAPVVVPHGWPTTANDMAMTGQRPHTTPGRTEGDGAQRSSPHAAGGDLAEASMASTSSFYNRPRPRHRGDGTPSFATPSGGSMMATFTAVAQRLPSQAGQAAGPGMSPPPGSSGGDLGALGIDPKALEPPVVMLSQVKPASSQRFPSHTPVADSLGTGGVIELPAQAQRVSQQRAAAAKKAELVRRLRQRTAQRQRSQSAVGLRGRGLDGSFGAARGASLGGLYGSRRGRAKVELPTPSAKTLALLADDTDYELKEWLRRHPQGPKAPTHAVLADGGQEVNRFGTSTGMNESSIVLLYAVHHASFATVAHKTGLSPWVAPCTCPLQVPRKARRHQRRVGVFVAAYSQGHGVAGVRPGPGDVQRILGWAQPRRPAKGAGSSPEEAPGLGKAAGAAAAAAATDPAEHWRLPAASAVDCDVRAWATAQAADASSP